MTPRVNMTMGQETGVGAAEFGSPVLFAAVLLIAFSCGGSETPARSSDNTPKSIPITYQNGLNENANFAAEPWQQSVDRGTYARMAYGSGKGISRPPDEDEFNAIQRLALEAEKFRGLKFIRPVDIRIENKEAMRAYVRSKVKRSEIDRMRIRYQALGMLDEEMTTDDILEEIDESDPPLGYYDPKLNRLVVRDDVAPGLLMLGRRRAQVENRAAMLHELVHALQDQHYQIDRALEQERPADERAARMALVEGDATLAMINYIVKRLGLKFESVIREQETFRHVIGIERAMSFSRRLTAAQMKLLFRYQRAALFVAGLLDDGGWEAVNGAFRSMPTSTSQIYEYQRYMEKWSAPVLKSPSIATLKRAGYRVLQSDVLGRLDLDVYLSRGVADTESIASDWNGDRLLVLGRKGKYAAYWIVGLSDPRSVELVVNLANDGYEAPAQEAKIPFRVENYGSHVLIMRGVDEKLHERLAEEFIAWAAKAR